jgi:glycosyltransferase involved in cell wall biosynthesis
MSKTVKIGIDATNLHLGGGLTHILEIITAANEFQDRFSKIIIWGSGSTLDRIENRSWLIKINPRYVNSGLIGRWIWQKNKFASELKEQGANVLFSPGGLWLNEFLPVVTMSQNLLPFEIQEMARYGISAKTLRLVLLRYLQSKSFINSSGIIFLTKYAKKRVLKVTGPVKARTRVIPHGINPSFICHPRKQLPIKLYTTASPYKIVYVSIIDSYKHQWNVVEAVARLRQRTNWPLELTLVGPKTKPAWNRLDREIRLWDPNKTWVNVKGTVCYQQLPQVYQSSDLGVFASSCENLPIILLEKISSGLPIASSSRGPMPEVLGNAGLYFDPLNPNSIIDAIEKLISDQLLREKMAARSFRLSNKYSWEKCAVETISFLNHVAAGG